MHQQHLHSWIMLQHQRMCFLQYSNGDKQQRHKAEVQTHCCIHQQRPQILLMLQQQQLLGCVGQQRNLVVK